jgi:hypothetical protein
MSSSRIDDLRMIDPVLTTVAQGYTNASMIAHKLFPVVQVSKLKGKIPMFGKEAFVVRDMQRAMRAASNRIPPADLEFIEYETQEKDIETAIDYIEEEETPDTMRLEHRITRQLADMMQLGREKEVADLVQDPARYETSLKKVITSSEAFNDYTLNIDPVSIIKDGMGAVRNRIARYPNTMIIGDSSYRALINHPKVVERVKYTGVSTVNRKALAELLDIDRVYVGMAVLTEDGTTFSDVWQDNIILAYVDRSENSSEYNPSFGYILQRKGKPEVDSYYENGGKIKIIRNTDNYSVKITAPEAAFLISDTNH